MCVCCAHFVSISLIGLSLSPSQPILPACLSVISTETQCARFLALIAICPFFLSSFRTVEMLLLLVVINAVCLPRTLLRRRRPFKPALLGLVLFIYGLLLTARPSLSTHTHTLAMFLFCVCVCPLLTITVE